MSMTAVDVTRMSQRATPGAIGGQVSGRSCIAWSTSLLRFAGKLERVEPQASGPAQSNPMCLLDFPVRSHLKPKASALSAVDVP